MRRTALRANDGILFFHYHFAAVFAVEYRYAMSPPELTGNTPVADILHPVKVDFGKSVGREV